MNNICPKCGNEMNDNEFFCSVCGFQKLNNENNTTIINNTVVNNYTSSVSIKPRNILIAIILTILTCGIYALYWFMAMTNESNKVSNSNSASGVAALIFTILTCGIYALYWNYKMGQKMAEAGKMHGKDIADNSLLYLVLSLFGLSIVNWCLIQSDLNRFEK